MSAYPKSASNYYGRKRVLSNPSLFSPSYPKMSYLLTEAIERTRAQSEPPDFRSNEKYEQLLKNFQNNYTALPISLNVEECPVIMTDLYKRSKVIPEKLIAPDGFIPNSKVRRLIIPETTALQNEVLTSEMSSQRMALEQLIKRYLSDDQTKDTLSSMTFMKSVAQLRLATTGYGADRLRNDILANMAIEVEGLLEQPCDQVLLEDLGEDDEATRMEKSAKLHKFARQVTKQAVQKHFEKKIKDALSKRGMDMELEEDDSFLDEQIPDQLQERSTSRSGRTPPIAVHHDLLDRLGENENDELKRRIQLEQERVLPYEFVRAQLERMAAEWGGYQRVFNLFYGVINKDQKCIEKLDGFLKSREARVGIVNSVVSQSWAFTYLTNMLGSSRSLMDTIDALQTAETPPDIFSTLRAQLTDLLGTAKRLEIFSEELKYIRKLVEGVLVERGAMKETAKSVLSEALSDNKDAIHRITGWTLISDPDLLIHAIKMCSRDRVQAILAALPSPRKEDEDESPDDALEVGESADANLLAELEEEARRAFHYDGQELPTEETMMEPVSSAIPPTVTVRVPSAITEAPEDSEAPPEKPRTMSQKKTQPGPKKGERKLNIPAKMEVKKLSDEERSSGFEEFGDRAAVATDFDPTRISHRIPKKNMGKQMNYQKKSFKKIKKSSPEDNAAWAGVNEPEDADDDDQLLDIAGGAGLLDEEETDEKDMSYSGYSDDLEKLINGMDFEVHLSDEEEPDDTQAVASISPATSYGAEEPVVPSVVMQFIVGLSLEEDEFIMEDIAPSTHSKEDFLVDLTKQPWFVEEDTRLKLEPVTMALLRVIPSSPQEPQMKDIAVALIQIKKQYGISTACTRYVQKHIGKLYLKCVTVLKKATRRMPLVVYESTFQRALAMLSVKMNYSSDITEELAWLKGEYKTFVGFMSEPPLTSGETTPAFRESTTEVKKLRRVSVSDEQRKRGARSSQELDARFGAVKSPQGRRKSAKKAQSKHRLSTKRETRSSQMEKNQVMPSGSDSKVERQLLTRTDERKSSDQTDEKEERETVHRPPPTKVEGILSDVLSPEEIDAQRAKRREEIEEKLKAKAQGRKSLERYLAKSDDQVKSSNLYDVSDTARSSIEGIRKKDEANRRKKGLSEKENYRLSVTELELDLNVDDTSSKQLKYRKSIKYETKDRSKMTRKEPLAARTTDVAQGSTSPMRSVGLPESTQSSTIEVTDRLHRAGELAKRSTEVHDGSRRAMTTAEAKEKVVGTFKDFLSTQASKQVGVPEAPSVSLRHLTGALMNPNTSAQATQMFDMIEKELHLEDTEPATLVEKIRDQLDHGGVAKQGSFNKLINLLSVVLALDEAEEEVCDEKKDDSEDSYTPKMKAPVVFDRTTVDRQRQEILSTLCQDILAQLRYEFSVCSDLTPSQRAVWMTLDSQAEVLRECCEKIGYIASTNMMTSGLASFISSVFTTNLLDCVTLLQNSDNLSGHEKQNVYHQVRNMLEVLGWFNVNPRQILAITEQFLHLDPIPPILGVKPVAPPSFYKLDVMLPGAYEGHAYTDFLAELYKVQYVQEDARQPLTNLFQPGYQEDTDEESATSKRDKKAILKLMTERLAEIKQAFEDPLRVTDPKAPLMRLGAKIQDGLRRLTEVDREVTLEPVPNEEMLAFETEKITIAFKKGSNSIFGKGAQKYAPKQLQLQRIGSKKLVQRRTSETSGSDLQQAQSFISSPMTIDEVEDKQESPSIVEPVTAVLTDEVNQPIGSKVSSYDHEFMTAMFVGNELAPRKPGVGWPVPPAKERSRRRKGERHVLRSAKGKKRGKGKHPKSPEEKPAIQESEGHQLERQPLSFTEDQMLALADQRISDQKPGTLKMTATSTYTEASTAEICTKDQVNEVSKVEAIETEVSCTTDLQTDMQHKLSGVWTWLDALMEAKRELLDQTWQTNTKKGGGIGKREYTTPLLKALDQQLERLTHLVNHIEDFGMATERSSCGKQTADQVKQQQDSEMLIGRPKGPMTSVQVTVGSIKAESRRFTHAAPSVKHKTWLRKFPQLARTNPYTGASELDLDAATRYLQQVMPPSRLTQLLTELRDETSTAEVIATIESALEDAAQKGLDLEDDMDMRTYYPSPRPSLIPVTNWRKLKIGRKSSLGQISTRPAHQAFHCRYSELAQRGFHKQDLSIANHLAQLDLVECINRSIQQRAYHRIQSSMLECLKKVIQ